MLESVCRPLFNFIKIRLQDRYFPVNIAKFLRTAFYRAPPVAASGLQTGIFTLL